MRRKAITLCVSLVVMTSLSGIMLTSNYVTADDSIIDDVAISVPISCTMMGTGTNTHNDEVPNGTYKANIGTTTLKVYCNDSSGFSIYAIGFTGEQYSGNNTKLIGVNSNQIISTGTAESGNTSNWAMKLATNSGATYPITLQNGYGAYSAVPATYTKVATRATATDIGNNATGAELTTTYASYMSSDQIADTYSGKVKYTLVHPANEEPVQPQPSTAGYINYYANASTAEGTMGRQSASDGNIVKLFASNFSRDGYGFAGWSDAFDYATNPNANFYGPNEDIVMPTGTTANGLALYAVWIKSAGTMQENTTSICNSLIAATYNDEGDSDESTWSIVANLNSISALTDTRDNQTYAIAKLSDGKCWMIENLRLADKDSNNNIITLSSANTNNPSLPLTNVYDTSSTSNHLSPTSSVEYNASTAPEGWCTTYSATCYDQSRIRTDNTTNRATYTETTNMTSQNTNLYSYGNYYNWYSATAGNGVYDTSSDTTTSGDICPYGWHLPTGTGAGEFGVLSNNLGGRKESGGMAMQMTISTTPTGSIMSKRFRHFPNNLLYSGTVNGSSLVYQGEDSNFWSSTSQNNINVYLFGFVSDRVYPGTYNYSKNYGRAVRCIATSS